MSEIPTGTIGGNPMKQRSQAFASGLVDGADWELDGYDSIADAVRDTGWSAATINAMGREWCAEAWGVPDEGPDWERACDEYEQGVQASLTERLARETATFP
jgi:hypothetical protein